MTLPRLLAIALLLAPSAVFADDEATPPATEHVRTPTGTFELGAGYNSDDGFLAQASVVQPNLFGTGHRLALDSELSMRRTDATLSYEVPDLAATGLDVRGELFASQRQYPWFTRESLGGAVIVGKRLGRTTRVWTRYRVEHVAIEGDASPIAARVVDAPPLGDGLLATLGAGFEYTTLDTPFLPLRGTRVTGFVERADRRWGSDYDLDRAGLAIDHARPLGPFTLRLHGHGSAVAMRDGGPVPLAFRLFHDGHREVRGYAFDESTPDGDNVEAVGRAELELPVWKRAGLSVTGWFDAGWRYNADAAWSGPSTLLQRSAGFGIIWRSPIGPLRLDWAIPLDGVDRHPQFLVNIGGAF